MTRRPKILILGGTGLLGRCWASSLSDQYEVAITINNHQFDDARIKSFQADLNTENCVRSLLEFFQPELVVNCVGKTDIEACQDTLSQYGDNRFNVYLDEVDGDHFQGYIRLGTFVVAIEDVREIRLIKSKNNWL